MEEEEEPAKVSTASKSKRRKEIGVQHQDKVCMLKCLRFSSRSLNYTLCISLVCIGQFEVLRLEMLWGTNHR